MQWKNNKKKQEIFKQNNGGENEWGGGGGGGGNGWRKMKTKTKQWWENEEEKKMVKKKKEPVFHADAQCKTSMPWKKRKMKTKEWCNVKMMCVCVCGGGGGGGGENKRKRKNQHWEETKPSNGIALFHTQPLLPYCPKVWNWTLPAQHLNNLIAASRLTWVWSVVTMPQSHSLPPFPSLHCFSHTGLPLALCSCYPSRVPLSSVLVVICRSLVIKTALWLSHVIVYWIKENLNTIVINTEPITRQALLWHSQYCLCRPLLFWLQTVSQDSAQLEEGSKPSGHWHRLYQSCFLHTPPLKQRRSWQSWHREPGNHYRN